jgi:arogenate dehydrogenase (NADP+)
MKIGLVGYGRFGKVWADMLKQDFEVLVYKRSKPPTPIDTGNIRQVDLDEVLQCETIFYAVPIDQFEIILKQHCEQFHKDRQPRKLIDLLSVKVYPKVLFQKYLPEHCQALLLHPMYGPDSIRVQGLAGQPIVMDRFSFSDPDYQYWKEYFTNKSLDVIEMSAEEHDQYAANSQGITHFIGRVLDEVGMKSTPIDTLGTQKLLEIKAQTCNDSWELFCGLQTKNPYTSEMRVHLGEAVDSVYNKLVPNRVYQDELVVGIQGGSGSFNEEAVRYYLNRAGIDRYRVEYLHTTEQVLNALHEATIDRGQFAIHNSTGGMVEESIQAMASHKFRIVEQFSIVISHSLMIRADSHLEEVDTIMSHPQVLKQCTTTLKEKYGRLQLTSGQGDLIDHAQVAKLLGSKELPPNIATMGSKILAEIHNLRIVEDNLQDLKNNYTSFLWVERP